MPSRTSSPTWRSIRSTNALERVNAEIDGLAKVVGIFPNSASSLRLSTAVLQEQHDEWQDGRGECTREHRVAGGAGPARQPRRQR